MKSGPAGHKPPYLVLFTLWLMVFSSASQVMIIAPILPRIGAELGVESSLLGLLMTAYAVAVGLFALITGPISDHYGRRRVMLAGTALMTVSLALHVLARDFTSLLILRSLAGAAGGVLSGAAVAFVGDHAPRKRRAWANGWIMSGLAAGQIAGIPLGILLAGRFGFQAPFLVFAVAMGLTFVLIYMLIPATPPPGSGALTLGTAIRGYRELLRRGDVAAAAAAFLFMFSGLSLFVIYLPAWLASAVGFSAGEIASLYFVGGLANVLTGPRVGRLSDRVGRKPVIVASSLGLAAVIALTPAVGLAASWAMYGLFFAAMALTASRASPFQALLTEIVGSEQRGSLISLTVAVGQIGFGLGGAAAGFTYDRLGFSSNALLSAAAVLVTVALVWRFLEEPGAAPRPHEADPSERLRAQGELCGPCPEGGYGGKSLQDACAENADRSTQIL